MNNLASWNRSVIFLHTHGVRIQDDPILSTSYKFHVSIGDTQPRRTHHIFKQHFFIHHPPHPRDKLPGKEPPLQKVIVFIFRDGLNVLVAIVFEHIGYWRVVFKVERDVEAVWVRPERDGDP